MRGEAMSAHGNGRPLGAQGGLSVRDLRVYYHTQFGDARAVDGVSFDLKPGERFGLVGESGCGKTTLAMAILRLIRPPGQIVGGEVRLGDLDLLSIQGEDLRRIRWSKLALIMQGAMNSLNPVMRVRDQFGVVINTHEGKQPPDALAARIAELLSTVGLPARVAGMFPHELSGGMKQRACIAMAIALKPELIIADEPTSALDVLVQRVVAQTLVDVQEALSASLILIGHDMGLQAQLVNRLGVMYAGKLVEVGEVDAMFERPSHPYTQLLTSSLPSLRHRGVPKGIPGLPPPLWNPPPGCLFHPRCPYAMELCAVTAPEYREIGPGHHVACHRAG
jgi:peptide/nickel transport system ATP-binding protein